VTAYAAGRLPWRDGMFLADYLDAVDVMEAMGATIPRATWYAAGTDGDAMDALDDILGAL
jgi:hypothetical protein